MYVNDETLVDFISETFGNNYGYIYYNLKDKIIRPARILGIGNTALIKNADEVVRHAVQTYGIGEDIHDSVNFQDKETGLRYRILFMKEAQKVAGVLLIVDNVERKRQLLSELENYLQAAPLSSASDARDFETMEEIKSLSELGDLVQFLIEKNGSRSASELYPNAKIQIVRELKKRGVFKFKGAISMTAPLLNISTPTIYRYLSQLDEHQPSVGGLMPEGNIRLI